MWISRTGIIASSVGNLNGVLDTYSGASFAFSLRRLSSIYTGYCIRVRRSSDNTSQDIGYLSNGDLDTASLLSFVGAGNGFVSIWYNQATSYDASQITLTKQPQIVSSGAILTKNGKPTIKFDGVDDFLVTSSFIFVGTDKIYVTHVATTTTAGGVIAGHYKSSNPSIYMIGYRSTGRSRVEVRNSLNTTSYLYTFDLFTNGNQYLYEKQFDLLNATSTLRIKGWRNGASETMSTNGSTTTSLPTFTQPFSIGSDEDGAANIFNGNIQEIIAYYNVDQSSNRIGISSNINTYYTIY
jgi:hypothetical protein